MTAIEAMIYCLGFVSSQAIDGDFQSQCVYDKDGHPHWFAWREILGKGAPPEMCSEDPLPFAACLEPYRGTQ